MAALLPGLLVLIVLGAWLGWQGIIFVGTFVIVGVVILAAMRSSTPARTNNELMDEFERQKRIAHGLIETHAIELSDTERRSIVTGRYGEKDSAAWEREKTHFIDKVIRPALVKNMVLDAGALATYIDSKLTEFRAEYPELAERATPIEQVSPMQYEVECTKILITHGWDARTTKASGDQGADIVAKKGAIKVVIQCKQYSRTVGNKAVQEVHAAKAYYNASHAAVVTNSTYTKAARILAERNGVILLHNTELYKLEAAVTSKVATPA